MILLAFNSILIMTLSGQLGHPNSASKGPKPNLVFFMDTCTLSVIAQKVKESPNLSLKYSAQAINIFQCAFH